MGQFPVRRVSSAFVNGQASLRKLSAQSRLFFAGNHGVAIAPGEPAGSIKRGGRFRRAESGDGGLPDARGHLQAFLHDGFKEGFRDELGDGTALKVLDEGGINGVAHFGDRVVPEILDDGVLLGGIEGGEENRGSHTLRIGGGEMAYGESAEAMADEDGLGESQVIHEVGEVSGEVRGSVAAG